MYDYLRAMGRGGNQENLNLGMIKSLKVLVPPPELVTKYVDILQRATKIKSKAVASQNQIDCLAMSFSSKFFA
jgi:type I restriction enzyme S subunit